jgi:hypothetical protein
MNADSAQSSSGQENQLAMRSKKHEKEDDGLKAGLSLVDVA